MEPTANTLEQLMRRGDIWRGHSRRFVNANAIDSGYPTLNQNLTHQGWPTSSLIEVCQPTQYGHSEWQIFSPALVRMQAEHAGYIVLINPPALPFCQGLIQQGINLNTLLILRTNNKQEFIASFVELAKANSCSTLLAWQPQPSLNYTELRKCLLACAQGEGLYVLFSPLPCQQQSSPASLRLSTTLTHTHVNVTIFKQKGQLQTLHQQPVQIPFLHNVHRPICPQHSTPLKKPTTTKINK